MGWWDELKSGVSTATGGGEYLIPGYNVYAIGRDIYNATGDSASTQLGKLRGQIPQQQGHSPYFQAYQQQYYDALQRGQPGSTAYRGGAYYQTLQEDVTQQMRGRRGQTGGQMAASGLQGSATYGPGARYATENAAVEGRLRQSADAQASQQYSAQQSQYIDQLRSAGTFESAQQQQDFLQQYQLYLAKFGLTQAQVQAEMQKAQMWLGLIGQGGAVGAQLATGGGGA